MGTSMVEHDHGCGFIGGILRRRKFRLRKPTVHSLSSTTNMKDSAQNNVTTKNEHGNNLEKIVQNSNMVSSPRVSVSQQRVSWSSSGSSTNLALVKVSKNEQNEVIKSYNPLNTAIPRVSSGNILKLTQINGLKSNGNNENSPRKNSPSPRKSLDCKGTMGNILRSSNNDDIRIQGQMSKFDPEELKFMGNEKYKDGKYDEALVLYEQAIGLDAKKAVYRSNKGAALMALGRLLEGVMECKEAVRIDPFYLRAHHRLGLLYFRLGFPEEALEHFSHSAHVANFADNNQAKALQTCLRKCTDAKSRRDWTALMTQAQNAFALGADSALQVYALQAQALLNLHRHDEAYEAFRRKPCFDMDLYTQLFGLEWSTYVYMIETQVYTAAGRFEDAITAAQNGVQLDPSNKELRTILIKAQSISLARSKGNTLFKELKFSEACNAYNEGLEYNPYNSVLLCNRAACRSKLGQFEKALEDCTLALNLNPSYSKARLRRANCNTRLGRWEASMQDYEILLREKPGDEEVARALFEAKIQVKKLCGEDVKDMKFGSDVVLVSSIECFRHLITSPGMSVVLFCNKSNQEKAVPVLEQVCTRFPSINFLKVEVEDHPYLTKSEEVNYIPAFKIYKNGSRVRDIPGNNLQLLETSVKLYSS